MLHVEEGAVVASRVLFHRFDDAGILDKEIGHFGISMIPLADWSSSIPLIIRSPNRPKNINKQIAGLKQRPL